MISALNSTKPFSPLTEHILRADRLVSGGVIIRIRVEAQYITTLRIANECSELRAQLARMMRRTGEVLVLLLAQPAEGVVHKDTGPHLVGRRVSAPAMKHCSCVTEH